MVPTLLDVLLDVPKGHPIKMLSSPKVKANVLDKDTLGWGYELV